MASWTPIACAPLYTGSKHAILGIMRSLATTASLLPKPLRLGCIHPFFAETSILRTPVRLFLAGIPLTTTERVAGAIFYAATDPDESTNQGSWMLADDGEVFLVPKEEFKFGVYAMLDQRVNGIKA
jgi:NAD(P)-dependent dehydrogenase (short-subunit alcohol dehydrogenase family)